MESKLWDILYDQMNFTPTMWVKFNIAMIAKVIILIMQIKDFIDIVPIIKLVVIHWKYVITTSLHMTLLA